MFASLRKAANLVFDRAFTGVVVWSLLLTVALYAALFTAAYWGVHHLPVLGSPSVNAALDVLVPVLMLLLPFFLGAPVAAFFASLFLDDIAKKVEARYYPADPKASGAPFAATLIAGLRLGLLVIVVDLLLLPFDAVLPGFAELATVIANGWLLGREYFEMVALRHMSRSAVNALRRRHPSRVFFAGVVVSVFTVIPLANLYAPLFGAAFMVHVYKRMVHEGRPV